MNNTIKILVSAALAAVLFGSSDVAHATLTREYNIPTGNVSCDDIPLVCDEDYPPPYHPTHRGYPSIGCFAPTDDIADVVHQWCLDADWDPLTNTAPGPNGGVFFWTNVGGSWDCALSLP